MRALTDLIFAEHRYHCHGVRLLPDNVEFWPNFHPMTSD
jgi:hypothetical protein